MRQTTLEEGEEYDALINGIAKVITEIQPKHNILMTVLIKLSVAEMIHTYGWEDSIKRFSVAINDAVSSFREQMKNPNDRRRYTCRKCAGIQWIRNEDAWGKILTCRECGGVLADNRELPPPQ